MAKTPPKPSTSAEQPQAQQQRTLDPRNPTDAIDGIDLLTQRLNVGTREQCAFFAEAINTLRDMARKSAKA